MTTPIPWRTVTPIMLALVLAASTLVGFVVAQIVRAAGVPQVYEPAPLVIVAAELEADTFVTMADRDGVALVDVDDGGVPIALGACAYVDEPVVAFARTWTSEDPVTGRRSRVDEQQVTFPVRLTADQCRVVSSAINVPEEVDTIARRRPDLVWTITWATTPVDPEGQVDATVSEPFRLVDDVAELAASSTDRTAEVHAEVDTLRAP